MYRPIPRCQRCGGSVISQKFTDASGRGTRWTCLSCADERELLESDFRPPPAELRRIFEPGRAGRPRKAALVG